MIRPTVAPRRLQVVLRMMFPLNAEFTGWFEILLMLTDRPSRSRASSAPGRIHREAGRPAHYLDAAARRHRLLPEVDE